MDELVLLKLGGSLITDKSQPHTPRLDVMDRLADEIAAALDNDPGLTLIVGHGSGSFGHVPGRRYGTRQGVRTSEEWFGFVEVWREAAALNRLVVETLGRAGLLALPFSPLASVTAEDGEVLAWDLAPLQKALAANLLPVVQGDVVFDVQRGGTILSTEDLFKYLARHLEPQRILLAGLEPGVWVDYPACTHLLAEITSASFSAISDGLGSSASTDVTGGMASKVLQSLELARSIKGLEVVIFSGEMPGAVTQALSGEQLGTVIRRE